jgi:hypothetical protein
LNFESIIVSLPLFLWDWSHLHTLSGLRKTAGTEVAGQMRTGEAGEWAALLAAVEAMTNDEFVAWVHGRLARMVRDRAMLWPRAAAQVGEWAALSSFGDLLPPRPEWGFTSPLEQPLASAPLGAPTARRPPSRGGKRTPACCA